MKLLGEFADEVVGAVFASAVMSGSSAVLMACGYLDFQDNGEVFLGAAFLCQLVVVCLSYQAMKRMSFIRRFLGE